MAKKVFFHFIFFSVLVFQFTFAFAELYGSKPAWSIELLNGQRSFNDGPNCYNAVLTAKGFSDFLLYSDPIEFHYYLANYCHKNLKEPVEGDILIAQKYFIKHAGINLRAGFIYEKRNIEGSDSRKSRFSDTTYRINDLKYSSQFNQCTSDPVCAIEAYSCQSTELVRNQNRSCVLGSEKIGLVQIQRRMQRFTMDPNQNLSTMESLENLIRNLTVELGKVSPDNPCDMYIFVTSASVLGYIQMLNYDKSRKWVEVADELKKSLNQMRLRLTQKYKVDLKYKILLEESLWLSRPVRYE